MTTAELEIHARSGVPPHSELQKVRLVRRLALLAWLAALVFSTLTWGVPLQSVMVIAWTCAGLACASIGRERSEIVQLVKDWAPLALILLFYDVSRGVADQVGIPVHFTSMIDFDRWVFAGQVPTVWLQERIIDVGNPNWWEAGFTLVYTSHFIVWLAIAGVLWNRNREMFRGFTRRLLSLSFAGLITYIVYPAAPPWMASQEGLIETIHRSTANGWNLIGLRTAKSMERGQAVVNKVAAVPSLHAGFAALIAMYFWPRVRWYWRPLLAAYPLAMGLTLMATGEHYFFDILLGWIYAAAVLVGWNWWDKRTAGRAENEDGADASTATVVPVAP